MHLRRLWITVPLVIAPAWLPAHEHTYAAFMAGSHMSGSSLVGFHGVFEWTPTKEGCPDRLSYFVDASAHSAQQGGDPAASRNEYSALLGAAYTFGIFHACQPANQPKDYPQITWSIRLMPLALQKTGATAFNETGGILGVGAALDIVVHGENSLRVQYDVLRRYSGGPTTHHRISVGGVIRWEKE